MKKKRKLKDLLSAPLGKKIQRGLILVLALVGITVAVNKGCITEETGEMLKETTKQVVKDLEAADSTLSK